MCKYNDFMVILQQKLEDLNEKCLVEPKINHIFAL
jgi:hypothetical protein